MHIVVTVRPMSQQQNKPSGPKAPKAPLGPLSFPVFSPASSIASLTGTSAAGPGWPSSLRSATTRQTPTSPASHPPLVPPAAAAAGAASPSPSHAYPGSALNSRGRNPTSPKSPADNSSRPADRADALWAEMQATLEEVELSASGGTHVFGAEHDRKLAELRAAQIALAQAWARSEAEDAAEAATATGAGGVLDLKSALGHAGMVASGLAGSGVTGNVTADATEPGKSIGSASARATSDRLGSERLGLEEETEADILLARKRREANDRYFSRVDQGVRDVVARLQEVAVAMKAVERESRDIWGEASPPRVPESAIPQDTTR